MAFDGAQLRIWVHVLQVLEVLVVKALDCGSFSRKNDFSIFEDIGVAHVIPEDFIVFAHVIWLYFNIGWNVPSKYGLRALWLFDYNDNQFWWTSCSQLFDLRDFVVWINLEADVFHILFIEILVQFIVSDFVFVPYE